MQQNTNGIKYKQNEMQKYQNINMPKYKRTKNKGDKMQNDRIQKTKYKWNKIQIRNTFTEYGLRFTL